jgi:hypothetical protein
MSVDSVELKDSSNSVFSESPGAAVSNVITGRTDAGGGHSLSFKSMT